MKVKRIIMGIVLALALVVPVVQPGFVEQTEIVHAKDLNKKITKKNYKKIKNGMTYKQVKRIMGRDGLKEEEKWSGDDKYVLYEWYNYKTHACIEVWFENGKACVKYYTKY